ncbi:MAG: hypothetical protein ACM3XN_09790 [Chloroflexota bacterium]
MASYASGVVLQTTLRRERKLPVFGHVLVNRGDVVDPATVVAETDTVPGEPYVIDIFQALGQRLNPEEMRQALRKRVGDRVTAGEVLAQHRFSRFSEPRTARSPVDGTIEFISRAHGRVMVREDPQSVRPHLTIHVADDLEIPAGMVRLFMRFREGDEVHQGTALAAVPDALTGIKYSYAPASGIISEICTRTGNVVLIRPSRPATVRAYLRGRVERVIPELGAVITGRASLIQGVFGVGYEVSGRLRVLAQSPADEVQPQMIDENCRGRVIVSGSYVSLPTMRRALDVGASGIITGGIDHLDLVRLVGSEISAGITGQEDLALTVVVTEGFGRLPMGQPAFDLLRRNDGQEVSLNGSTQVRAGVIRPEVVIPLAETATQTEAAAAEPTLSELACGVRVRLLGRPHFGQTGVIVERPTEPVKMESEISLRVVVVELTDGRRVTVPEANIDVI